MQYSELWVESFSDRAHRWLCLLVQPPGVTWSLMTERDYHQWRLKKLHPASERMITSNDTRTLLVIWWREFRLQIFYFLVLWDKSHWLLRRISHLYRSLPKTSTWNLSSKTTSWNWNFYSLAIGYCYISEPALFMITLISTAFSDPRGSHCISA